MPFQVSRQNKKVDFSFSQNLQTIYLNSIWSPTSLFYNGEVGAWYDPSDLTTLFQDSAGITPVTADGQSVGLVLDKSQGLVLGPELVTNGTFDSNISGWTDISALFGAGGSTISWSNGALSLNVGTSGRAAAEQVITTVPGKTYRLNWTPGTSAPQLAGRIGTSSNSNQLGSFDGRATTFPLYFTATTTTTYVSANYSVANTSATVDNISVRELPGNHLIQSTAGSRPLYKTSGGLHWLQFDGTDDFLVSAANVNPGSVDKAQVFAGMRKLSDAAPGIVLETSVAASAPYPGSLNIFAPRSAAATNYGFRSGGSISVGIDSGSTAYAAPITKVLGLVADISGDFLAGRVDGTQVNQSTSDQGTGNFLSYPLYVGRRAGILFPFNGNIYSLILRFSAANLDATVIEQAETWTAGKCGVTL